MEIKFKVKRYTTGKSCCKENKSLIEITMLKSVLGESYSAQCLDCGNTIEGYRNVKNLLLTTNRLLTPFLLNKANQN
jgi:hypothetical protein